METTKYFSYLIRIWQDEKFDQVRWHASLEDPTTKHITYFKTIEELFGFLREQSVLEEHPSSKTRKNFP